MRRFISHQPLTQIGVIRLPDVLTLRFVHVRGCIILLFGFAGPISDGPEAEVPGAMRS